MRSTLVGTNLGNALSAIASQPGYLIELQLAVDHDPDRRRTFRYTTLDTDFVDASGVTWVSADMQLRGGFIDERTAAPTLVIGDPDLEWWFRAIDLQMQDAPVMLWQVYAEGGTQTVPLWSGHVGEVRRGDDLSISCELLAGTSLAYAPRRRVQYVVSSKYLVAAGTVFLINGQKWVVQRKNNAIVSAASGGSTSLASVASTLPRLPPMR